MPADFDELLTTVRCAQERNPVKKPWLVCWALRYVHSVSTLRKI